MKKIIILFILLFTLNIPVYAKNENEYTITASDESELYSQFYNHAFSMLDKLIVEFEITITGEALDNFTYDYLLNSKTIFEGDMIDEYINSGRDDYNAILIRKYTISKAVQSNILNPGKALSFHLSYKIEYDENIEQKQAVIDFCKKTSSELIKDSASDFERVKILHDYVVKNYRYDDNKNNLIHDAYSMMNSGYGVCSAYSSLFYTLLSESDIKARIVFSEAYAYDNGGRIPHAWNLVNIDGFWYHIDSTWNDGDFKDPEYFLISDEQISADHTWDKNAYPTAPVKFENTNKTISNDVNIDDESVFSPVYVTDDVFLYDYKLITAVSDFFVNEMKPAVIRIEILYYIGGIILIFGILIGVFVIITTKRRNIG